MIAPEQPSVAVGTVEIVAEHSPVTTESSESSATGAVLSSITTVCN